MSKDDEVQIPELPLRVGDSDQSISGIVVVNHPAALVEITVRDLQSGQEWRLDRLIVPAPVSRFVEALNHWRASIAYPKQPEIHTRTLDPNDLGPYCLRYRQAFELLGEGSALTTYRRKLWGDYRKVKEDAGGFPTGRGLWSSRRAIRRNFSDALDAYLAEWKENKGKDPFKDS